MTLKDSLKKLPAKSVDKLSVTEAGDDREVVIVSPDRVETAEQALEKAQVDTAIWEVERMIVNNYESQSKLHDGIGVVITPLFQIKLFLRRRAPKEVQEGIDLLLEKVKRVSLKPYKRKKGKKDLLAEVSVYDAHFGNLAFGQEISLDDQSGKFIGAVSALLKNISPGDVDSIVMPIGHDLLHFDSWKKQTTKGTQMEALSESLPKVFEIAELSVRESIRHALQIAPVKIVWVPGNHDYTTSYYLCKVLEARFQDVEEVSFDLGEEERKYHRFGNSLFGYTHGEKINHKDLPLIMAAESPDWSSAKYRYWRTGHKHRKQQMVFMAGDEHKGVRVDVMPSLAATDCWHHGKGFVANCKAAELWITDRETGYKGHFSENIG